MRIVAGTYRSRVLKSLSGEMTRPTLDKVKEAVFSRIGPYFNGGNMLDLFGGSGNMGLEAISRGMKHVIFCDSKGLAQQIMKENIRLLGVDQQCTCLKMDYQSALKHCVKQQETFDFIYLDPPYKKQQIANILIFLDENQLVKPSGNIVCESLKEDVFEDSYGSLYKVKEATYGITKITYYQRRDNNDESTVSRNI